MKNAALGLLFACLLLAAPRLTAQSNLSVYFLGRADTNHDGLVNSADRLALYRSVASAEAERVSDEAVDVAGYLAAPSGAAVYLGLLGGDLALDILPPGAAPIHVALTDFQAAQLLALDDALWLLGVGVDRVPVIRGIDPHSGAVIAERALRRPNTQVTLSAGGDYALAYHARAGAISVFRLPGLQTLAFELSGYALSAPLWSPTALRFLMAAEQIESPGNYGIYVVDAAGGTCRWLDAPDFPDAASVSTAWSGGGRYIAYNAPNSPLYLLDADFPDIPPLELPVQQRVVTWAADDALALVASPSGAEYFTLDPAGGQVKPFAALDAISPSLLSFAPRGIELALIGQSHLSGEYGLYITTPGEAAEALFSSPDPAISLGASLQWSPDGERLIYTAASLDPLLTSLGAPLAVYVYDRASGVSARLSPENVLVSASSMLVI